MTLTKHAEAFLALASIRSAKGWRLISCSSVAFFVRFEGLLTVTLSDRYDRYSGRYVVRKIVERPTDF